jgi:hypothetical protein
VCETSIPNQYIQLEMRKKHREISVFHISQATTAIFPDLYMRPTFLFFIQSGSKKIMSPHNEDLIGEENDLVICASSSFITMQNSPKLDKNYQAIGLSYEPSLVKKVFITPSANITQKPIQLIKGREAATSELLGVVLDTINRKKSLPPEIYEHRLMEPLIWLNERNYFIATPNEQLIERLRKLIEIDLSHAWNIKSVSEHFAMSESTMRRALKKSGYGFARILLNARLEKALSLLQTTDIQIVRIALECGFKSPSHFSEAFNKRFGIPPKAIRMPQV